MNTAYMGQDLLNPPSVEGWHTGKEWINSGSLDGPHQLHGGKDRRYLGCPASRASSTG